MNAREHSVRHSAEKSCAETRDRTGDLQIFSLTLSQLSYRGCCPRATTGETHGRRSDNCKEAAAPPSASQDARLLGCKRPRVQFPEQPYECSRALRPLRRAKSFRDPPLGCKPAAGLRMLQQLR